MEDLRAPWNHTGLHTGLTGKGSRVSLTASGVE